MYHFLLDCLDSFFSHSFDCQIPDNWSRHANLVVSPHTHTIWFSLSISWITHCKWGRNLYLFGREKKGITSNNSHRHTLMKEGLTNYWYIPIVWYFFSLNVIPSFLPSSDCDVERLKAHIHKRFLSSFFPETNELMSCDDDIHVDITEPTQT